MKLFSWGNKKRKGEDSGEGKTPLDAQGYFDLGIELDAQGKTDEAIEAYRKAIKLKPNIEGACMINCSLGYALSNQGKHEEAFAAFYKAIELRPDFTPARHGCGNILRKIGFALLQEGKFDRAVVAYRKVIELDPDPLTLAETHCLLGSALQLQGKAEEAEKEFREAIRLKPSLEQELKRGGIPPESKELG